MMASRAPYWIGETGRPGDGVYNVRIPRAVPELSHVERTMRLAAPLLPDGSDVLAEIGWRPWQQTAVAS